MKNGRTRMTIVRQLKIDRDCHVDQSWIRDYVNAIQAVCHSRHVKVISVQMTYTRKGQHFYIDIQPPVSAELANQLQWLLGDDCRRVDYNRSRIRSKLNDWNKLFEDIERSFHTLYPSKVPAGTQANKTLEVNQS